jgi:hypothetical protein
MLPNQFLSEVLAQCTYMSYMFLKNLVTKNSRAYMVCNKHMYYVTILTKHVPPLGGNNFLN